MLPKPWLFVTLFSLALGSFSSRADLAADSPVKFPASGALPAKYPPDLPARDGKSPEEGWSLFSTPQRSLGQIRQIQKDMPQGEMTVPAADPIALKRTLEKLQNGGRLNFLALGDSIVSDTMRSGWINLLQEAYPKAEIHATASIRGSTGCPWYREEKRVSKHLVPLKPDLVFIGGISQKDMESIREVIKQFRAELPEAEFLLATGTFGMADPRDAKALAGAAHSGTGEYGKKLRQLAQDEHCAFLDMTAQWAEYILSSKLHPHLFYRDVVHANEFGEQILAKILMAYFKPNS